MIPLFKVFMAPEAGEAVAKTLASGMVTQGPRVDEFEAVLRQHFRHPHVVTVNSCTSAIHLALHVARIKHNLPVNTKVICTPLTCAASNFPVVAHGFEIVWADIDPTTLNIDLGSVYAKLTAQTRILLLVHWGGSCIDYARLAIIKREYLTRFGRELIVIEDCAHAWGTSWKSEPIGRDTSNYCCFSFQAIKTLTTSDGGLLLTPDEESCHLARRCRWFGLDRDNKQDFRSCQDIEHWGFKFHMNDIAATIGLANYPHIQGLINMQLTNAEQYDRELSDVPGLRIIKTLSECDSSCWLYTIRVERREDFVRVMTERGVQVHQVHVRNDKYTTLKQFSCSLPAMDRVAKDMICIPAGWWLTQEDRDYIIAEIKKGW